MKKPKKQGQQSNESSQAVDRLMEKFMKLTPEERLEACQRLFTEVFRLRCAKDPGTPNSHRI